MNNKLYILLLINILLLSCRTELFVPDNNIIKVDTGVVGKTETYFDNALNKDMFYYVDKMTNKCIKIYDCDFNFVREIKLDKIKNLDFAKSIQIINHDSIIMTIGGSQFISQIYLINFNGEMNQEISLKNTLKEAKEDFLIEPTFSANKMFYNSKLYAKYVVPRDNQRYFYKYDYNYNLYIDSMVMTSPFFVTISLDANNKQINKLFNNIYKENYQYGQYIDEIPEYSIANNKLFLPIENKGRLYVIDLVKEEIETSIYITSDYTKVGHDFKMKTIEKGFSSFQIKQKYRYASLIQKVLWDKYRKIYYVILRHAAKQEYDFKTFSIQVFDENLNKKGEQVFDYTLYKMWDIKVVKKGLLINCNTKTSKDYEKNVEKYTLFRVNL